MNYPKEFYVTTPIVGDKVWLSIDKFTNGKNAFHGPWWILTKHIGLNHIVTIRRENGPNAVVYVFQLLRMSKTQIKKMAVLKNPV